MRGAFDGRQLRLYVDGAQIGTPVPAAVSVYYGMPTGDDFYLGDYGGPCANPLGFVGDIDAAAVLGHYDPTPPWPIGPATSRLGPREWRRSHPLAPGPGVVQHEPMTPELSDVRHLFTAIDHVGIAVPDLDEAMAFYREAYGMEVLHEEVNEEQGVREAMVGVGDSGSCIQLLAPLSPESTIAKFLERNGQGIQQLAFRVDDVEHVADVLRGRGLRLLYDAPRRGTSDSRVNFIHPKDAGGVLVELVEPAARPH